MNLGPVLATGVLPRVIEILSHHQVSIQLSAIRFVGNVFSADEKFAECCIQSNALEPLAKLMGASDNRVRKEATWALSNACAGTSGQLEAVLQLRVFPKLVYQALFDVLEVRAETVWAIGNACAVCTPEQLLYMAQVGVLEALGSFMAQKDAQIVSLALEALKRLMDKVVLHRLEMKTCDYEEVKVMQCLEQLQNHPNTYVANKAQEVLLAYFDIETDAAPELLGSFRPTFSL